MSSSSLNSSVFPNRITVNKPRLNPNPPKPKIHLPRHEIIRRGHTDYAILQHTQVIKNLLQLEKRYFDGISSTIIFGSSKNDNKGRQTDIQPWMRKTVTSWLLEVCEELHMETEVYFVAVNMMDRMMAKLFFKREHFQLLAAASLMIASKLKETLPVQPDKVIIYTDNSISFEDLIRMEQIILSELVWDVSSPTPVDFVDILCHRLSDPAFFGIDVRTTLKIKSLAICIAQQTTIEHHFIGVRPSKIACAAIILACHDYLPPIATEANKMKRRTIHHHIHNSSFTPPNKLSPDKGYSTANSVASSSSTSSSTEVTPDNFNEKYNIDIESNPFFQNNPWNIPVPFSENSNSRSGSFSSNSSSSNSSISSLRLKIKYKPRTTNQILETIQKATKEQFSGVRSVIKKIGETGIHKVPVEPVEPPPPVSKPKTSIFDQFKPNNNRLSLPPNYFSSGGGGLSPQIKHNLSPPEPIGSRKIKNHTETNIFQSENHQIKYSASNHSISNNHNQPNLPFSKSTSDFQQPLQPLKRQHTSSSSFKSEHNNSHHSSSSSFLAPHSNYANEIENIETILRTLLPDNLNTSSDMFL